MKRRSFLSRALSFLGLSALGFPRLRTAKAATKPKLRADGLPVFLGDSIREAMAWSEYCFDTYPDLHEARSAFTHDTPWALNVAHDAITYGNSITAYASGQGTTPRRIKPTELDIAYDELLREVCYTWQTLQGTRIRLHDVQHIPAAVVLTCHPARTLQDAYGALTGWHSPPLLYMGRHEMLHLLRQRQAFDLRVWLQTARPGNRIQVSGEVYSYVSHVAYILTVVDSYGNRRDLDIDHLITWQMCGYAPV